MPLLQKWGAERGLRGFLFFKPGLWWNREKSGDHGGGVDRQNTSKRLWFSRASFSVSRLFCIEIQILDLGWSGALMSPMWDLWATSSHFILSSDRSLNRGAVTPLSCCFDQAVSEAQWSFLYKGDKEKVTGSLVVVVR